MFDDELEVRGNAFEVRRDALKVRVDELEVRGDALEVRWALESEGAFGARAGAVGQLGDFKA